MLNKYMKINMTHAATVIDAAAARLLAAGAAAGSSIE
jgi:hypothetical protein